MSERCFLRIPRTIRVSQRSFWLLCIAATLSPEPAKFVNRGDGTNGSRSRGRVVDQVYRDARKQRGSSSRTVTMNAASHSDAPTLKSHSPDIRDWRVEGIDAYLRSGLGSRAALAVGALVIWMPTNDRRNTGVQGGCLLSPTSSGDASSRSRPPPSACPLSHAVLLSANVRGWRERRFDRPCYRLARCQPRSRSPSA